MLVFLCVDFKETGIICASDYIESQELLLELEELLKEAYNNYAHIIMPIGSI